MTKKTDAVVLEKTIYYRRNCLECNGARLQKSSLAFKIDGKILLKLIR